MGHSQASKANTHARLVAAAAARFKERGVDGISLAELMKDLKLTHGGFYRHFDSREELVSKALEHALTQSGEMTRARLFKGKNGDKADLRGFVDFYLDEAHRDARADGCAVAALAGDAQRKNPDIQAQFRNLIERNLEALTVAVSAGADAAAAPGSASANAAATVHPTAADARATALLLLSALHGALTLARAAGDSALSHEILRSVRKQLPALGGARKPARARRPKSKSS